jgi:hypothetical protein
MRHIPKEEANLMAQNILLNRKVKELEAKLKVAIETIEMNLPPLFDHSCEGCRGAARVSTITLRNIKRKDEEDSNQDTGSKDKKASPTES